MSQSRSADVVPAGTWPAQRTADAAPVPRPRRVAYQLIVLVAIPAVLALAFTGLWITNTARSAAAYGRVGRLATLGQQVTGLAQAMADERSGTAAYISGGRAAASLPALRRQYAITDGRAAQVRRLIAQLGHGYPAQTRAAAAHVLASINMLPGLRRQAGQSQTSAPAVIASYSAATSGLFPVIDGIADQSGNSTLITSVRALGSLARMSDHASQQQAILGVALAGGRFAPGALAALTTAQAQQASDLASFRASATSSESWALTETLARPPARQAQAVEQRAMAAGDGALALGPQASQQWSGGMSYTVGWMDHAEQQLAGWITADAQALQQNAMRSALIIGGAALGILALVLLGTVFAVRSMVRRRGRLEAAALEEAEAPLPSSAGVPQPISASAVSDALVRRNHSLQERLLRLIDSSELNEDDPERLAKLVEMDHLATRIWRNSDSALVLAGHETVRPAGPLALVDMLRAAAAEIEEYGRVVLDAQHGVRVSGSAATDTVHLLAELLENATAFSPDSTRVIMSGHAVYGGGSLVTITDAGTGMSEEELTLLNWQLANPSLADMAVDQHMGLRAVALLAARHGITVTLSMPPDGGTTAEVYLPAALTSLDAEPGGWRRKTGEASVAGVGQEADARVADLPLSARRLVSRPEPSLGPEIGELEAVPLMLGAPVLSPAPEASTGVTEPPVDAPEPVDAGDPVTEPGPADAREPVGTGEPVSAGELAGAEPDDGPPIFESVRSGYLHAFGRDLLRLSEQQAGQSPAERPARPPASWGNGNGRTAAGPPTAGNTAASGPPPPVPQPGQVRGASADQETRQASAADAAEIAWRKLASFQRGSRRARTVAQRNRSAKQPGQDG